MGQRGDRDMKFIDLMMMEKENLEKTIRLCAKQLKHLPRGTLSTQNKSGHIYYTKRVDRKRMYLRNDSQEIQQLKDRHMAELVLDNASHDLELMNQIMAFTTITVNPARCRKHPSPPACWILL